MAPNRNNVLHKHETQMVITLQTLPQIPNEDEEEEDKPEQPPPPPPPENENQVEFTCEICIEPTMTTASFPFTNGGQCSHPFCADCVAKYIRAKLDDGNAGRVACPAVDCGRALDPRACASLAGRELFVRWCDLLCEAAAEGLGRCYCPYGDCGELIVNECGGIARKSKCPRCGRWLCFECGSVWHAGFGCEERGEMRDRNDVAFGRLAEEKKWMRCPWCRHFVELVAGCRVVRCRCGMSFCYNCGKRLLQCRCNSSNYMNLEYYNALFLVVVFVIFTLILVILARTHKELLEEWQKQMQNVP